jgi:hypothetical protein
MATEAEEEVTQTFEKEVNLIAYAVDNAPRSERKWVEQVTGVDVTSYETETETTWEMEADLGGTFPMTRTLTSSSYDEEEIERQKKELEKSDADITLAQNKNQKKKYENSLSGAALELLKGIRKEFQQTLAEKFAREVYGGKLRWKDDVGNVAVSINKPNWDSRRVLAKEENRTSDSLYTSLTERHSAQFSIRIEAKSEDELDEFTEETVRTLHKVMSKQSGIGQVRYMECEIVTRKEGECYNI